MSNTRTIYHESTKAQPRWEGCQATRHEESRDVQLTDAWLTEPNEVSAGFCLALHLGSISLAPKSSSEAVQIHIAVP